MNCSARGCEALVAPVDPTDRWALCAQHVVKWDRLQIELPLAIQELHALALLHANAGPLNPVRRKIATAEARVEHLRQVEHDLGGGWL